jgi:putative addiction module component (TIGR02574 family)
MSTQFEEIQRQVTNLPPNEKAALARQLIEELDETTDPDVEQLWVVEAQRRYESYLNGEIKASSGDEVMNRARARLS